MADEDAGFPGPVLHLCSDYSNQHIYTQLVEHLRRLGVHQRVFAAVRSAAEAGRRPPDRSPELEFDIPHILRKRHRLLFGSKVRLVCRAVSQRGWDASCSLLHAHFLYSDGVAARRLALQRGVPFVTAVRNTDIFTFGTYRPDLWPLAKSVLNDAAAVVFLTPTYRDLLLARLPRRFLAQIRRKTTVIPSGVSLPWLRNPPPARARSEVLRAIYVGNFTRNKNIDGIIRAMDRIRSRRKAMLTLVGGGGDGEGSVRSLLVGRSEFVERHAPIHDPDRLREIVRSHDVFVMPSFRETFGVVYLEALSQGLPIVHSRDQGVSGLIRDPEVSLAVDPTDAASIASAAEALFDKGAGIRARCVAESSRFSWDEVAETYLQLYRDVLGARPIAPSPWQITAG
jgi:glycosyltransferase involved in cell wall biosynthesis